MKVSIVLPTMLVAVLLSTASASEKQLAVITSLPELAEFAREIGGNTVNVESLAKGYEDIHAVPVRPSLAAKLARADVLIELGLEAEHAWLPPLIDASNNPKINKVGLPGRIVVSEGVTPKEVPLVVSRAEGEQHPSGNPHINVGPDMGRVMITNVCNGLSAVAPGNKALYEANLAKYLEKLAVKENEWAAATEKLKGIKCISYHPDTIYLVDFLGMELIGTIEPKPGIPPSASHTAEIIKLMKSQSAKIVIREPQYSDKLPNEIAAKTGAKVANIAMMVNGLPEAKNWIAMIDTNIAALLKAAQP
jgi:zinc/manganese transport system substrate-binding protein